AIPSAPICRSCGAAPSCSRACICCAPPGTATACSRTSPGTASPRMRTRSTRSCAASRSRSCSPAPGTPTRHDRGSSTAPPPAASSSPTPSPPSGARSPAPSPPSPPRSPGTRSPDMNTELTERYIRATISGLPAAAQEDVRAELTTLIMDATEARIDRGEEPASAERAALTELGDPAILTAEYADRPLHLIGPRHYLAWRRLLRLLLWIVPACAVAGVAIGQALVQAPLGTVIGQAIAVGIGAVVHVSFWVTVVFMILERTGTETGTAWDLDQLPAQDSRTTSRSDAIASVAFAGVGIGAVLWDQLRGLIRIDGERLPLLNPELWPAWSIAMLGLLLLEAVLAVVVVLRRRSSPTLATVT